MSNGQGMYFSITDCCVENFLVELTLRNLIETRRARNMFLAASTWNQEKVSYVG